MIYPEIVTTALMYADRVGDIEITDRIDHFLRIVESRLNRSLDMLIGQEVLVIEVYTAPDVKTFTLPADFNGLRDIYIVADSSTKRVTLEYISPIQMNNANYNVSGNCYYNIQNGVLNIYPALAENNSLHYTYKQKLLPIDALTNVENIVTQSYPDCYVFGLLVEISSFVKDVDATKMWDERFSSTISEIVDKETSNKWSGTPLVTRVI